MRAIVIPMQDLGIIKVVFVSSDGVAPELMHKQSSYSRCLHRELHDVSDEAVLKCIEKHMDATLYKQNKTMVEDLVHNYTGGRMMDVTAIIGCTTKDELHG